MDTPNFDRMLKVLWREQPDRVPFYEHLIDPYVMETIMKKPIPSLDSNKRIDSKKRYIQYLVDFFKLLGYDCITLEWGLRLFRMNTNTSTRQEPLGRKSRGWVDNDHSTIANQEEFNEYEWPKPEDAIDYELFEIANQVVPANMKIIGGVAGGVFEHVSQMLGLKALSIQLRKDPQFIANMFNKIGSLIADVDKRLAELSIIGALRMGDDMGFKTATLVSPQTLRKYVFPWQKKVAEIAHKANKPFVLHSCGNLSEIMTDLIDDVKINAIHSFQDLIYPVTEAKAKWGDKIAILGGIDLDVLCTSPQDQLQEYIHNTLIQCKKGGGYALGSGNSIPNYTNIQNYLLMLELGKKYGRY